MAATVNVQSSDGITVDRPLLIGRDSGLVDVVLNHPTVSRRHARLAPKGPVITIADLGSSSGTFVNGEKVYKTMPLPAGATLGVGALRFTFDGKRLTPWKAAASELSICCAGLGRVVPDRSTGHPLPLLTNIWLGVHPKELVCLIGPSGSGKSTLLTILSGRVTPSAGHVLYGGRNLHHELDQLKHDIAVVPQREALHVDLTVGQALRYAAGLRLPSDTTPEEISQLVDGLLEEVGLTQRKNVRIRDLSGGQLKRISLAIEIAHRPSLVFLDEVTSGLDELGDEEMMQLFRQIAEKGRSVVCITHNTLNIERNADIVVVLASGGRLACIGSPAEICAYFKIPRLGDVYGKLSLRSAEQWEQLFVRSALKKKYVDNRIPAAARKIGSSVSNVFKSVSARRPIRFGRQFSLLVSRVAALQLADFKSLLLTIGQAVFIGIMLVALFGDVSETAETQTRLMNSRNAVFLLLVSVFWLGCNNAAPEVVKERLLFERERLVSVNAWTYYLAKLLVLGVISCTQAATVYGLMAFNCGLPALTSSGDAGIRQAAVVGLVALLGTLSGLAISTQSRSEAMAVRAVPLLLIPQIVLSNVIADLDGFLEVVARIGITTFWAFRAFTGQIEDYYANYDDMPSITPAVIVLVIHCTALGIIGVSGLIKRHQN